MGPIAEVGSTWVTVAPSAVGFGKSLDRQVGGQVDTSGKTSGKRYGTALKVGALAVLGGAALAARFLGDAVGEARESQRVTALTASVIKATGGAANVTAGQVANLAGALSAKTGIDDEVIQSGQNMLLTFKNVRNEAGKGNDVFNQSTKSLIDMASAMGTEPKQAAIQLGKALNDPIKGITALSRVGVTFTEGQKKQIKTMVETGNVMGAQKVILKELNSEFGGAAAAQATSADKARVAWGNLKETIGTKLLPVIDRLSTTFTTKIAPAVTKFVDQMGTGEGAGGKFADTLGDIGDKAKSAVGFLNNHRTAVAAVVVAYVSYRAALLVVAAVHGVAAVATNVHSAAVLVFSAVTKVARGAVIAWAAAQWVLNAALAANPIGLVVVALAAIAVGLVLAYKKSETFRKIVDGAMKAVGAVFKWLWNNAFQPMLNFILTGLGNLMKMWGTMLRALSKVPGFGWAKEAGDKMYGAGVKALGLRDSIKKIPDKHDTKITADTSKARAAISSFNAFFNDFLRPRTIDVNVHVSKPGGIGGLLSQTTGRAAGGPINAGQTYLVGEKGPELFTSRQAGRITPNHKLTGSTAGRGGAMVNIEHMTTYDASEAAYRIRVEQQKALTMAMSA